MRNFTGNLGDAHVERELADTFETGQTVCCWPELQRFTTCVMYDCQMHQNSEFANALAVTVFVSTCRSF